MLEQLGVVDDLVVAPEGGVLVLDGVEAVRAAGDDLLGARLVEGGDVHLRLLLVQVLVAQTPHRVTGAGLLGTEDAEGDAGPVQHAGRGLHALAGPLVEGAGAADPVEVLDVVGDGAGDDRDLEVEALGPLGALVLPESPRVALVLHVAQHEPGLGRELGLHEHLVAAHVDDGVDVLDVDRALLHAGPAGRAGPQHVGVDDVGHQGGLLALAGMSSGVAEANMLSRRPMMRSLGDSGFSVFQAGQADWQRPHSVQVAKSSICFQVKWPISPTPNTVSSSTFSMSMSGVLYRAPRARGRREKAMLIGAKKMCRCLE